MENGVNGCYFCVILPKQYVPYVFLFNGLIIISK